MTQQTPQPQNESPLDRAIRLYREDPSDWNLQVLEVEQQRATSGFFTRQADRYRSRVMEKRA